MDKIAIHKEAMEKIAARAWKKVLPKLSDANYKRLVDAGVYNKNKELQGLRRGTHNILQKYDAKMIRNPRKAGASSLEIANMGLEKGSYYPDSSKRIIKKSPSKNMSPFSEFPRNIADGPKPIKSINNKTGGINFVPKNAYNNMLRKAPDVTEKNPTITPLTRRDRDGRKWTQALMERHEADETRFGMRNTLNKNKQKADYMGHHTPKVLMQESANVGLMPREVKNDVVTNMRKITGEASDLQNRTGVGYGSSAVYDKKAARKAEKSVIRQRRNEGWNGIVNPPEAGI